MISSGGWSAASYLLLVLLGGGIGAMARLALVTYAGRQWGTLWPWGIWTANIGGALLAGAVLAVINSMPAAWGSALWWLLLVGLLGSLTTVSSFSLHTLLLFREHGPGAAAINLAVSVGGCLVATVVGFLGTGALLTGLGGGA
ncbi:CrcB family protein [Alcanivorax sp. JB21]|uniref:fluoride efflux transporter FluC n=1 Tax=Alcanivorax limicola TaxID=2874102 RepID=UPI001CBE9496|nr:CrcB family protein [Alcanivorax limicola]MBZ2187835.1 CrcB family protein [Alcanivorax limicola]